VTFNDRWFTGQKRKVLAVALAAAPSAGAVIEIGCWEGQSSVWFANHVYPQTLHCFDWWQGARLEAGDQSDKTPWLAKERDVYAEFIGNMNRLTKRNYRVWKGDWRETLPRWPAGQPIRFAYIDATHTYVEVRDNIAALLPLLGPGGVLSGDDFHHFPDVGRAVNATLGSGVIAPRTGHGAWYWRKED
jgi:predicted O-methyltransferase YrrM